MSSLYSHIAYSFKQGKFYRLMDNSILNFLNEKYIVILVIYECIFERENITFCQYFSGDKIYFDN